MTPEGMKDFKNKIIGVVNSIISLINGIGNIADAFMFGDQIKTISKITPVNDYRGGRGGISVMAGPAGVFRLNPMDSVIATTNPVPINDYGPQPAGSVGMTQKVEVTGTITGTRDSLMAVIEPALG